jgi:LmbE family N-acetylglucosaminyl deacetylase
MIKTRRVYILAHCDDELFCLPLLLDKNSENTLIFLTTLAKSQNQTSKRDVRKQEALNANRSLAKFITIKTLFYCNGIYDGYIHRDFDEVDFRELTRIVLKEKPDELVTLSYEAGHQDHDSVHIITRLISENQQLKLRCFSGYRASGLLPSFFSVLKPVSTFEKITFNRLKIVLTAIRLMIIYRSQVKTWVGLSPLILFKYAFFPFWESKYETSLEPKQNGHCFYEKRGRAIQSEVIKSHQRFVLNFRLRKNREAFSTKPVRKGEET